MMTKFTSALVAITLLVMTLAFAAGVSSSLDAVSHESAKGGVATELAPPSGEAPNSETSCVPTNQTDYDPGEDERCECPANSPSRICIIVHHVDD